MNKLNKIPRNLPCRSCIENQIFNEIKNKIRKCKKPESLKEYYFKIYIFCSKYFFTRNIITLISWFAFEPKNIVDEIIIFENKLANKVLSFYKLSSIIFKLDYPKKKILDIYFRKKYTTNFIPAVIPKLISYPMNNICKKCRYTYF